MRNLKIFFCLKYACFPSILINLESQFVYRALPIAKPCFNTVVEGQNSGNSPRLQAWGHSRKGSSPRTRLLEFLSRRHPQQASSVGMSGVSSSQLGDHREINRTMAHINIIASYFLKHINLKKTWNQTSVLYRQQIMFAINKWIENIVSLTICLTNLRPMRKL